MQRRKIELSRGQFLSLLKECKWSKAETAKVLKCDEKSVRRHCERLNIDCELEKRAAIVDEEHTKHSTQKSTKEGTPNEGSFVVISDLHAQNARFDYLATVCRFIEDFKPSHLIQIGDLMDYECLMKIRKQKYPAFDGKDHESLEKEFQACSKLISMLNKATSKNCAKVITKGNHEYRADEIIKEHPEFKSFLRLDKRLDLTGYTVKDYLEPYKLGKLYFIHGEFYGIYHVQMHLKHYQKNVLYGHTHGIQQDTMASPMRKIPIWGASLGCLCDLNPDYQRNKSNRWQHGFGYGWFDSKTGDFDCQVKRIINGKFWAEGRKYHT